MNKRKQIITDVLLNGDFSNVQESMNTLGFTDRESRIIATTGRGEQDRAVWAERIHGMIQESTDLRTWKVQPKRYRKGYCATTFNDQRAAEHEQKRLERITGFEWTIKVMME
jgi:hypothetical protein